MGKKLKKGLKKTLAWMLSTAVVSSVFTVEGFHLKTTEAAATNVLSDNDRGILFANSRSDFRDESIYFLITTRFYDGDPSNNARTFEDDNKAHNPENDPSWRGDFAGLIEKLDYIKALGFTAVWITPVVQNDSGYDYHGYHAYDFSAVDTRYESNGVTYQDLIDAVHAKGMKIIQDVVLNHTCNWGEKNLLQITSDIYTERNKVVMNGTGDPENIYHHNGFTDGPGWDNYTVQKTTMHDDCFDLETENPKVYNYLTDCYTNYINMGVDGFRIDTVKHISRLTFNSVFLPAFKKAGGEDFYMFGEVCTKGHETFYRDQPPISTCFYTWADDSTWTSKWSNDLATNEKLVEDHYVAHMDMGSQPTSNNAFLNGNTYHTPDYSQSSGLNVIDFQMHWSFNDAQSAFDTAKGEDPYFNDSTWNVVYVDSHDFSPDQFQTQRYPGGTDAWAENLSLMFTFRGIPCIYYGTEIEFQKGKTIDPGPSMKLSETGRAYYGDHIEGNVDTADFTVFGNLSGEVKETLNSTLSQHIMRLNRIRQAIPALRKGQYSTEGCSGSKAFKRRYTDETTDSFCLVTISGDATFTGIPNGTYVDAVTGDTKTVTNGTLTAKVSGQGNMRVYVLNTSKTPAPGRVITNGDYLTDGGAAELIGEVSISTVDPTSITLNKSSVTVLEGKSVTVTATVAPDDASNKRVTWTSSDKNVATVSGGKITGVSVGTATITAKTSNGLTATVKVTVKENPDIIKPTGISLNKTSLTLTVGDTENITATITPTNATNKNITWTSSDDKVATVSNGSIEAVGEGTATITATTYNGISKTVKVTVNKPEIIGDYVFFKNTAGWKTVTAYMWASSTVNNGNWPGESMAVYDAAENIYMLKVDPDKKYTKIIFSNNGASQTADLTLPGLGYIYDASTGKWSVYNNKPSISASKDSCELTAATTVTFTVKNATKATYSLNGAAAVSFTDSVKLTVGKNATDKVVITATNGTDKVSKTYTYTLKTESLATPVLSKVATKATGVTLTWKAVTGATGYYVYRKSDETTNWTKIAIIEGGSTVTYTDSDVVSSTKYTYTVKATKGTVSGSYDKTGLSIVYLSTPDLVKLTQNDSSVVFTWGKVVGATGYQVYRKEGTGNYSKIATITKGTTVTYTDTTVVSGNTYTYTVKAVNGTDVSYYHTTGKSITVTKSATLDIPKLGSIANSSTGITVKWEAVKGATGYYVYRKTAGSSWSKVSTISDAAKLSYNDSTVTSGTTYIYTVIAFNASTKSSYDSKGLSILYIAAPKLGTAATYTYGNVVKWNAVEGAEGYIVFRKSASGSWTRLGDINESNADCFVDTTAKKGVTNYYTVRAYSGDVKSGYDKNGVSVTRK